ncbi:MAG: hypothetical protein QOF63_3116 [Thermoanaerobaculia bacterium]|nr:hypothetical protein [Thermoanaerobaculia bacterium]
MRLWIFALCLLALAACRSEKQRLADDLDTLKDRKIALVRKLDARTDALHDSERRLDALRAELTSSNTAVRDLLVRHQVVAFCIRASRETWGLDDSIFGSDDAIPYSHVYAALCSAGLMSDEFKRDRDSVVRSLRQAGARAQELRTKIAELQRTIEAQRSDVRNGESAVDDLAAEMAGIDRRIHE